MRGGYVDVAEGQVHYRTEGTGEPLVLLHQAPLSSLEFAGVMPLLASRFRVLAVDAPGHGNSYDPTREYDIDDYARAVIQFLDALGIQRTSLAGHHTGSLIALVAASSYPERFSRLVLSGFAVPTEEEMRALLKRPMSRVVPLDEEGQFLLHMWQRYGTLAPKAAPQVRFKPFIVGLAARVRPYDAHHAAFRLKDRQRRLGLVQCPTLLVLGDEDVFFDRERTPALAGTLKDGRVKVLQGGGAMMCFERPQEWAETVLAFLTG